ncbi:MAG: prepilin-type N-terminal cleavage/methylation domain-containing protein [Xanthomonadales bacterium]|nr:prepilin-type N-terminal cleavage/methylation domain-containing protein [Xanthomonadales bacterium]
MKPVQARGFTLLEVMLAFVIFALSFAAVLEIMAGSIRGIGRANDETEVALIAQTLMDQVGIEIPLEESEFAGEEMDRYRWQLGIYLYGANDEDVYVQELAAMSGIALYQVTLDIEWDVGRRQRNAYFSTIRSVMAVQ